MTSILKSAEWKWTQIKMEVKTVLLLVVFVCSVASTCFEDENQPGSKFRSQVTQDFQQVLYQNQLNFSLTLFHNLHKKHEKRNLFFSPQSIHKALMLALFGSAGETEMQLRKALQLDPTMSKTDLIRQYKMEKYFMEARALNTSSYDLRISNKVFFSDQEPLRSCILEILEGEIEQMNFENDTESSRQEINSWVSKNTNGKIQNIIPPGVINSQTRVAIVNSAYFKGTWEKQFDVDKTKPSLFYVSPKEVKRTEMMFHRDAYRHGVSESLRSYILELPYAGEEISMFILLPPFEPNALELTLNRLTAQSLQEAIDPNQLYYDTIDIAIPKFKIEQSFELNKALETIGVVDLFDGEKADLSGFSNKSGLVIGTAKHRSFVEVNEEGSEGGAATLLIDTRSGRPLDQTHFICNHPFLFLIHDNVAKTVLFMGAFTNPKGTKRST